MHSAEPVLPAANKRLPQAHTIYLWTVSGLGLLLVAWAALDLPRLVFQPTFLFLAVLVITAQFVTHILPVSDNAAMMYSISTALTIAGLPLYGLPAAILLEMLSNLSVLVLKRANIDNWAHGVSRLMFNSGMCVIAMFVAGQMYMVAGGSVGVTAYVPQALIWVVTVIAYDQLNLGLLLGMLRLQHGRDFSVWTTWRSTFWASSINFGNNTVGTGAFVLAVHYFGWVGMVVFSLPIFLSAYAFRIYVSQTKNQMANLEQIIAEHTQELKQLNQEKDAFLAVLTHDMKSPLTSIGIYATMLERYPDLVNKKPQTVTNILRAQQSLLNLVDNIVDLEKLQAGGGIELNRSTFELNELVECVTDAIEAQAHMGKIELVMTPATQRIHIYADQQQLERVVTNLVNNAVKYTPSGGHVHVKVEADLHQICVSVIDTGYGIPSVELPHIFERFRRVKKHQRVAAGTGLGLPIAKAMAEAHGGSILVDSVEGEGSTFMLVLPWDSAEIPTHDTP